MPIQFTSKLGLKPGLVIYLTVGDPDLATSRDVALAAIDAGADVLELGVPFSDPVADGPVIQRASERSLVRGTTLQDVLALAAELRALIGRRKETRAPVDRAAVHFRGVGEHHECR